MSWFVSEKGRKIVKASVCFMGLGLSSLQYLSNTFFLDQIKDVIQMYRHGTGVAVSQEMQQLFNEVYRDMDIDYEKRNIIKPFTVYGIDTFHAGSTLTKSGALIGIPSTFSYSCIDDVETQRITVMNKPVDWNSPEGRSFMESFVLSDQARKFFIGREVSIVQTPYVHLHSLYPFSVVLCVHYVAHNLNNKLKLLNRPFVLRGVMYILLGLFGLSTWSLMEDHTNMHFELKADKNMCALGEEYIRGGVEAYTKILKRNVALRHLLGPKGQGTYTASGNEVYILWQKQLPIVYRKAYMERMLQEVHSTDDVHS